MASVGIYCMVFIVGIVTILLSAYTDWPWSLAE